MSLALVLRAVEARCTRSAVTSREAVCEVTEVNKNPGFRNCREKYCLFKTWQPLNVTLLHNQVTVAVT